MWDLKQNTLSISIFNKQCTKLQIIYNYEQGQQQFCKFTTKGSKCLDIKAKVVLIRTTLKLA